MAKFKSTFQEGQPITMRGIVKFADDDSGRLTVTLRGYEIPITTNVSYVEKGIGGPAPKSNDNARVSR